MARRKQPQSEAALPAAVAEALYGAVWAMRTHSTRAILDAGITLPQARVVWFLEEHGQLRLGRLAALQGVTQANITGIITRLARDGLVIVARDPSDRRATFVQLTPKGRARTRRARRAMEAATTDLLGEVPHSRLETVLKVLQGVRRRAEATNPPE